MKTIVNVSVPATITTDLADLEYLNKQIFPRDTFNRNRWRRWIRAPKHCVFFVHFNGSLIGFGLTHVANRKRSETYGEILEIGILKQYRGKGVGLRLLTEMEAFLIRKDAKSIEISFNGLNKTQAKYFMRQEYHPIYDGATKLSKEVGV